MKKIASKVALLSAIAILLGLFAGVTAGAKTVQAVETLKNGVEVSNNMNEVSSEIKYTVHISKVSLVDIECTSRSEVLYFGLFDSGSQLIREVTSSYYAMSHLAQVVKPGDYTVRVQRKNSSGTIGSIGYTIIPRITALRGNEKTPDSSKEPVVLKMKKRVYGSIAYNDETDIYKFSIKQKGNVSVHLTCQMFSISNDMSRTRVANFNYSIKDSTLSVLQSGSVSGTVDSPSTSVVTREYDPGDYYVFVTRASENYTGEYAVMCIQNAFTTTGMKMTGASSVVVGKSSQFKLSPLPASSKDSKSTWTSSNPTVLKVSANTLSSGVKACKFTASECGEAVITAVLDSNKLITVRKKIKVVPASPKLSSVKNTEKSTAKVVWNQSKIADGYQIQYTLNNSKFNLGVKSTKVEQALKGTDTWTKEVKKQNSTLLKKLKKNKTYYVRIRSYKKGSDGKNYYSDWSKVQKVTIKK